MKQEAVSENKKRNQSKWNKRTQQYGAGILAFFVLIVAALWLPQLFFEISDALIYGEVSLMEQEKPDVLTLTTGYEESLYRRLAGFAEGLAGQRQYYVDEQPKEVTEEIKDFLFTSDLRFYADGIYSDVIIGMFSEAFGISLGNFSQNTGLELYQWNQYVIYSDDYAQGVNFILWCFGLKNSFGDNLTILMDAHDYTVYAVRTTGGTERTALHITEIEIINAASSDFGVSLAENIDYAFNVLYVQGGAWMTLNIYYDIFDQKELERYFAEVEKINIMWNKNQPETIAGVLQDTAGNDVDIYMDAGSGVPYGTDGESWYGRGEDGILYYSLPLQENRMTFDIYSFGEVYDSGQTINSTMGIREIYELIPEFQQFG